MCLYIYLFFINNIAYTFGNYNLGNNDESSNLTKAIFCRW